MSKRASIRYPYYRNLLSIWILCGSPIMQNVIYQSVTQQLYRIYQCYCHRTTNLELV